MRGSTDGKVRFVTSLAPYFSSVNEEARFRANVLAVSSRKSLKTVSKSNGTPKTPWLKPGPVRELAKLQTEPVLDDAVNFNLVALMLEFALATFNFGQWFPDPEDCRRE